jgi:hypothetical protein
MSPVVTDDHLINLCSVTCSLQAKKIYTLKGLLSKRRQVLPILGGVITILSHVTYEPKK